MITLKVTGTVSHTLASPELGHVRKVIRCGHDAETPTGTIAAAGNMEPQWSPSTTYPSAATAPNLFQQAIERIRSASIQWVPPPEPDPLDAEYDGVKLRYLLALDENQRRETNKHGRTLSRAVYTPAQRDAISAHWSAQLRQRVAEAPKSGPQIVLDCAEDL